MRDAGLTHGGFYKHFGSKDELLMESLSEAFQEIADRLAHVGGQSPPETAWKAIVKTYLSLEYCDCIWSKTSEPSAYRYLCQRGFQLLAYFPEKCQSDD
jgi:AcrR family transcriptional regulator